MSRTATLTDESPMPFGKHKGERMDKVPGTYLDWLMGQDWIDQWPNVVAYCQRSKSAIEAELKERGLHV